MIYVTVYKNINDINDVDNSFVVEVKNIENKEELLKVYNDNFKFPYFGYNWDSLYDCMCDLSWIKENNIIIVHSTIERLDRPSRKIYLKILEDVLNVWKGDKNKRINIFFNRG